MGVWGDAPWDNDTAADWFGQIFDETQFADRIAEGLNADLDKHPEIVRAAAHVVYLLGRAYVWPAGSLKQHLQLAVDRLQALADRDVARFM